MSSFRAGNTSSPEEPAKKHVSISNQFSDSEKRVLQKIEEGESVNELADILEVDKSTASRKVKKLEKKDLVSTEKQGRKKVIHLGFTGKIYKATF